MYDCLIKTVITENNPALINILGAVQLPEECEVKFVSLDDLIADSKNPDSLCIFTDITDYAENKDKSAYSALISDGKEIPQCFDTEKTELWIIPENCGCPDELLKNLFSALIRRIKLNFDYRRLLICHTTAADDSPDLIWYKNMRGEHLLTNKSFCDTVGKTKEQVYKKGHYYIWDIPQEEYEQGDYVCLESEQVVIDAGKTCIFDEKVKTKTGMRQFVTAKSPLYDINGELFGTCGVARDVTDLHKINSELRVVLESVPFGIMLEDKNETLISANKSLKKYFPEIEQYENRNCSEWKSRIMGEAIAANVNEFGVKYNGLPRILRFTKESVNDIFGEIIGHVIIFQDMTAERLFQRQAVEHANTDFLTGLNNRRSLFAYFEKVKKSAEQMSMITVDLDNFKKVNDTCGHKTGDEVLVQTAEILNSCFKTDFISRLGGDEFLVVITRSVTEEQLIAEAQRLIDKFEYHFRDKQTLAVMTVSAGISTGLLPNGSEHNVENLMYSSDCALYEAKKAGKSRCCFYKE